MGMSKKSKHISDKETQSPMLKIFKDIMQREKNDSEKAILIKKEKQENKKRKTYSGPLPKAEMRSCDSSSTERFKRSHGSKMATQDLEQQVYKESQERQNTPFSNDKKENWWFWKETRKRNDDTCSCVSCALKRVICSEHACLVCLALLIIASLVVAFLVFRNTCKADSATPQLKGHTSLAVKQTDLLKSRRQFRSDGSKFDERKHWTDIVTNPWRNAPSLSAADFGETGLRDGSYHDESFEKVTGAISRILGEEKLFDGQTSEKLRDFYKRLIQTDARIRKLKQQTDEVNDINMRPIADRYRRSLMSVNSQPTSDSQRLEYDNKVDLSKFNLFYPPFVSVKDSSYGSQKRRIKKSDDEFFNNPSGIVIENKKVMVQYGPFDRKRNFPKCSHMPKDSKSHEKQLKHPFYQNSQRLDELLGQLLEHNLDTVVGNPFDLEPLMPEKEKCKHRDEHESNKTDEEAAKQILYTPKNTDETIKYMSVKRRNGLVDSDSGFVGKQPFHRNDDDDEADRNFYLSTSPRYGVSFSVPTLMNPDRTDLSRVSKHNQETSINKRKLLQLNEEDDDNLAYEDLKEVLTDDTDTHDETDKQVERDRRSDDFINVKTPDPSSKYNIPIVHNANWKSPMQLYPDEFNLMLKNSIPSKNDVEVESLLSDHKEKNRNVDADYIEDYLNNKYSKLAQAYSDYGVLAAKKEYVTNEMNKATDNTVLNHEYRKIPPETDNNSRNILFKKRRNAKLQVSTSNRVIKSQILSSTPKDITSKFNISIIMPLENNYLSKNKSLYGQKDPSNMESSINTTLSNQTIKSRIQRSLKSINIENFDASLKKKFDLSNVQKFDSNSDKIVEQEENKSNLNSSRSPDGPSDILRVFADWFLTLAQLSGEFVNNSTLSGQNLTTKSEQSTQTSENVTKDFMYPMYDSDMIDNIGHRSRVLMSLGDENENKSLTETNGTNSILDKLEESIHSEKNASIKSNTTSKMAVIIISKDNANQSTYATTMRAHVKANRTVVKRNVDNNLILWNDIYDDEYGVKIDYFDNELRKKHMIDSDNFVKRSGQWINNKFKKLGESIRTGYNSKKSCRRPTNKKRLSRSFNILSPKNYFKRDQIGLYNKRNMEDEEPDVIDFSVLTAKMKQICHEATKAVQKTRNINVQKDQGGEVVATSLMQQLVKLMTDLVDFQVQQKTCSKLPPDMADFLQWLLAPSGADELKDSRFNMAFIAYNESDKSPFHIDETVLKEESNRRSECLAILRVLQELMHQYDEMSFDDKNKLMGVKEYLENQNEFLMTLILPYTEYSAPLGVIKYYRKRHTPARFKRHASQKKGPNNTRTKDRSLTKNMNKYTKKSDTKRTTTNNHIDSVPVTEGKKKRIGNINSVHDKSTTKHHKGETKANKSIT